MIEGILMLTGAHILLFSIISLTNYKEKKRGWKVKKGGNSKQEYLELEVNNLRLRDVFQSCSSSCDYYKQRLGNLSRMGAS